MNLSFNFNGNLSSISQKIVKKYSPISKKLNESANSFINIQNEQQIKRIVDDFMGDMNKLLRMLNKKGSLEPDQHTKLEFIANRLDEVSEVGRMSSDLVSVQAAMDKIFVTCEFDQIGRNC